MVGGSNEQHAMGRRNICCSPKYQKIFKYKKRCLYLFLYIKTSLLHRWYGVHVYQFSFEQSASQTAMNLNVEGLTAMLWFALAAIDQQY